MDTDGQNLKRLTDNPSWDGSPEWSTDGETLYFYSARPRELPGPPTSPILGQEGGFRIWAMAADGSNLQPITGEGMEALAPALTSDGRLAFQTRTGYAQWTIKSISLDDSQLRQESDEASDYWIPDFHHESGAMVAHGVGPVSEKSQAVEAILGDGALLSADHPSTAELPDRTLMIYPMRHTTGLAPHPMSDEVVVTIENEAGSRLAMSDYQGISEETIFTAPGIGIVSGTRDRLFDMKYSDDGEWITYSQGYFAGESDKQADVWIMRRDGSERTNLTKSDANDGVAGFSPDGTKLVFRSARAGSFDLYTMNTDGSEVQRITDHPRRDNFPVFSPMGDAIVFSSDRDSELDDLGFRTFDNYILELNDDGSPGVLRRLTNDRGQDSHPWYSPDANWVVFTSERDGISDEEPLVQEVVFAPQMYGEIYAQRLSDGLTIRLTHNKWEEGNPFWLIPLTASAD
jgi:Tol biopolymer transport system component